MHHNSIAGKICYFDSIASSGIYQEQHHEKNQTSRFPEPVSKAKLTLEEHNLSLVKPHLHITIERHPLI